MNVRVLDNQSQFDIAIQCLGSAEAAIQLAFLNDVSVTDDLKAGRELELTDVVNKQIANYYTTKGLHPATGITDDEVAAFGGIGYMAIGIDFIVS